MVYAKQIKDGEVVALLTYDYNPQFSPESGTVAITEEEYNELKAEFYSRRPDPYPDGHIADSEALRIITGEVDADDA